MLANVPMGERFARAALDGGAGLPAACLLARALMWQGEAAESDRVLRSFDPAAPEGAGVADPYYGGPEGFTVVREQIEAAADGIIRWVRDQLG